ncbi:MAG: hypothetical protein ACI89X_003994, partial [Planctomycetota bacterium]
NSCCRSAIEFPDTTPPDGVLKSADDGLTWEPASEAIRKAAQQPGYLAVHSLLDLQCGSLLAATFSDGVLQQEPNGTWTNVTGNLPTRSAGDLISGPAGRVYLHTNAGVFQATFPAK